MTQCVEPKSNSERVRECESESEKVGVLESERERVREREWEFKRVTFEYRHENKSCSSCQE